MDRRVLFTMAAVITAAVIMFSVLALPSNAESQAIEYNLNEDNFGEKVTFNVQTGDTLKITGTATEDVIIGLDTLAIGEIPGITVSQFAESPEGEHFYKAEGTITAAGTYKLDTKRYTGMTTFDTDTITINVALSYHTVKFVAGEGGTVDTESMSDIPYGTPISADGNTLTINGTTVKAKADDGYVFARWNDTTDVTDDRTITAVFEPIPEVVLTFTSTIGGSLDKASLSVKVGSVFEIEDNKLTVGGFTVTATAADGSRFSHWSVGDGDAVEIPIVVTAYFEEMLPEDRTITLVAETGGSVSPEKITVRDGSAFTVKDNTIEIDGVKVVAKADGGYVFDHWSVESGKVADRDMTVTAYFKQDAPGPEPTPSDDGKNLLYLIISVVSAVVAIITLGAALYGYRSPIVFVILAVATVIAVAMALLYFGVIKI